MEAGIERLTALALIVTGLSHITAPRVWARFFIAIRDQGEMAGFLNAFVHMPLGLLILAFHPVWRGPALLSLAAIIAHGWASRGRAGPPERRLACWMIGGGLIGAALPTPSQLQYVMPLLPPLGLALGFMLDDARAWPRRARPVLIASLCLSAVPGLLPALGPHGYLVVTYDEGITSAGCCGGSRGGRIATVVAGPDVRRGARMTRPIDHYGVLASIEDSFGLPHLGVAADARHGTLAPLFRGGRLPRLRG